MPTIAEIIAQSSGLPHEGGAVVDNAKTATFDWGTRGWNPDSKPNSDRPPAGMTEITGYFHGYNVRGKPYVACNMFCRNMQTWVRAGGIWHRVESSDDGRAYGGAYFTDMQTNAVSGQIAFAPQSDGSVKFRGPPAGSNGHWWRAPRGKLPAGVDATLCCAELRIDNPNASLIYGAGTDWWKVGGGWPGGNAASLCGSFIQLRPEWRWVCCTNLNEAELRASHPTIVVDSATSPPPPPVSPPPPPPPPAVVINEMKLTGKGKPGSQIEVAHSGVDASGNWSVTVRVPT